METTRTCARCGEEPAGLGGVLCPECLTLLARRARDYWREPDLAAAEDGELTGDVHRGGRFDVVRLNVAVRDIVHLRSDRWRSVEDQGPRVVRLEVSIARDTADDQAIVTLDRILVGTAPNLGGVAGHGQVVASTFAVARVGERVRA